MQWFRSLRLFAGVAAFAVAGFCAAGWAAFRAIELDERLSEIESSPKPGEMHGPLTLDEVRDAARDEIERSAVPQTDHSEDLEALRSEIGSVERRVDDLESRARSVEGRLSLNDIY